jgi:hypothetical protein
MFGNTNGGVKNVKLMRPIAPGSAVSYDTATAFATPAKDLLKKFSVLRFMQVVNAMAGNNVANWSDRTPPTYSCQQARPFGSGTGFISSGICWEYLIQLCNETGTDIFVNIPFGATDDYVRQLATLLKNTLAPEHRIYTEYSNELWNGWPYDGGRNYDSAAAEAGRGNTPLTFDGETNVGALSLRRAVRRDMEISTIFRSVFGDSAMMTRVRPLYMAQVGGLQGTGQEFMMDYYNNPAHVATPHPASYYFYGSGGAPYYAPTGTFDINSIWTSGDMDTAAFATSSLVSDMAWCATFGLKCVAYEGGPVMPQNAVGTAAWQDSRLTKALVDHHNAWSAYGGDLFVYYTANNWGHKDDVQWSFIHYIEQTNTPKMRAVDSLNATPRVPVTFGHSVPTSIPGTAMDLHAFSSGDAFVQAPAWRAYVIRVDRAGTYGVTVDVSNVQSGTVLVLMDGVQIGTTALSRAGTTPKYVAVLTPGLHGVLVRSTSGAFNIDRVNISVESYSGAMNGAGMAAKLGSRPAIASVNGHLRLRLDHGAAFTLCTIQGRTMASGSLSASANAQQIASPAARIGNGVYLLHTAHGNAAGVLVR